MNNLFNVNPAVRTADEWRKILFELVLSLSLFLNLEFEATSWFVNDDQPGYANSSNSVDIKAIVHSGLGIQVCGVLCLDINFGEAVWASCDLLMFTLGGKRLLGEHKKDLIVVTYDDRGWNNWGWAVDGNFEWESYIDNSRWI